MTKWLYFHTLHSPVDIKVNQGNADITADWYRLNWDNAFINGESLLNVMNSHEISKDALLEEQAEKTLKNFFSKAILLDYKGNQEEKEQALETLMKSFHQGGLLHPVSAGMSHVFAGEGFGASASAGAKQVNIQRSATGFTVQEIYTVKKCVLKIMPPRELMLRFVDGVITPDPGKEYVLKAQATIDVSFKKDGSLNETLLNQGISYGNDFVQSVADQRNWWSKLIDVLKNILGLNAVKDISVPEKPNQNIKAIDDPKMQ